MDFAHEIILFSTAANQESFNLVHNENIYKKWLKWRTGPKLCSAIDIYVTDIIIRTKYQKFKSFKLHSLCKTVIIMITWCSFNKIFSKVLIVIYSVFTVLIFFKWFIQKTGTIKSFVRELHYAGCTVD